MRRSDWALLMATRPLLASDLFIYHQRWISRVDSQKRPRLWNGTYPKSDHDRRIISLVRATRAGFPSADLSHNDLAYWLNRLLDRQGWDARGEQRMPNSRRKADVVAFDARTEKVRYLIEVKLDLTKPGTLGRAVDQVLCYADLLAADELPPAEVVVCAHRLPQDIRPIEGVVVTDPASFVRTVRSRGWLDEGRERPSESEIHLSYRAEAAA